MKSLDIVKQEQAALLAEWQQALKEGQTETAAEKMILWQSNIQQSIMAEYSAMIDKTDAQALAARGLRTLTSEERQTWNTLIQALKGNDFKQAVTNANVAIPTTTMESVLAELREAHPLLANINLEYLPANVTMIINRADIQAAVWGKLCDAIVKELTGEIDEIATGKYKLSAFIYVCVSMLELGPEWLDRYVREILFESLQLGLEEGIVKGNGISAPIGMMKNLEGPVDTTTGYPDKVAVALNSFKAEDLATPFATLATKVGGGARDVGEVLFIYNPIDYYTKIFQASNILTQAGYINMAPHAIKFIASSAVPQGKAILGIKKRYKMFIAGDKEGTIGFSDHYKFLEGDRTYLIKLMANGEPLDNNAFVVLDITNIQPIVPKVGIEGIVQTQEVAATP